MTTPIDIILRFVKSGQGDDQAIKALKDIERNSESAGKNFDGMGRSTTSATSNLKSFALGATAVVGTLVAVGAAAKQAYEFISEGAALDAARTKFENLTVSIGSTSDAMLGDLRAATKGMVSDAELMASASQIISLGLSDTQDGVTRLATVISALGLDMQQVILTFANNSTARLDALGLSIEDVKSKAAELEAQGFQGDSFDEAVLIALEEKMALLGDASQTTAGSLQILEASWKNLTDGWKQGAAEALAPTIKNLADNQQRIEILRDAYDRNILTYTEYRDAVSKINVQGQDMIEVMRELGVIMDENGNIIGTVVDGHEKLTARMEKGAAAATVNAEALREYHQAAAAVAGVNEDLADKQAQLANHTGTTEQAVLAANLANQQYFDELEAGAAALEETAAAHAAAAAERAKFAAETGDLFTSLSEADGALKFFNEDLDDLGQQFVSVGGRTAEQSADLERLQTAYDKAAQTIRDYELGIKGANLTDEARAEKIAEQQALMDGLSASMQPLLGISSELVSVNNQLSVNQDAVNQAMIAAADAAGADAGQLALLKVATGELTPVQAEAVIKSVALEQTLKNLGQQYAEGSLTLNGYIAAAQQAVVDINNMTVNFDTATGSVTASNDAVADLIDTINRLPTQHDFVIKITQDGEIPALPNAPSGGQAAGAFADGGLITGGTAVTGYGQDNVMIAATTGEYVLKPSAVRKLGLSRLNHMNSTGRLPGFADGGYVGDGSTTSTAGASIMFAPVIQVSGVVDRAQAMQTGQNVLDGLTHAARGKGIRI